MLDHPLSFGKRVRKNYLKKLPLFAKEGLG
jgi:hypothetical protein